MVDVKMGSSVVFRSDATVSRDHTDSLLAGCIAFERDTVQEALVSVIVIDRVVQHATVIPKRNRTRLPAESTGELWLDLVCE